MPSLTLRERETSAATYATEMHAASARSGVFGCRTGYDDLILGAPPRDRWPRAQKSNTEGILHAAVAAVSLIFVSLKNVSPIGLLLTHRAFAR